MRSLRSISRILLFLTIFVWTGCGDSGPTGQTGENSTGTLTGRVVDSANPGAGVAGATVRIEGTDQVVITGADGSFEFEAVDDGDVAIVVDMPDHLGYEPSRVDVSIHGGHTVNIDVTVLPEDMRPQGIELYPQEARAGILSEVRFHVSIMEWPHDGQTPNEGRIPRPTWSILSDKPIGVISREGTFIGTAPGRGEIVATFSSTITATAEIVVVSNDDVVSLFIGPWHGLYLNGGEERYFGAIAINGAGQAIDESRIEWSLDPADMGVLESAADLTEEEREEILRRFPYPASGGYYGPDDFLPEFVGEWSLIRFRANEPATDLIEGQLLATAGTMDASLGLTIAKRGELDQVFLGPDEIRVREDQRAMVVAWAVNQFERPIRGLEISWSLEPADLGTLEEVGFPYPWCPECDWVVDENGEHPEGPFPGDDDGGHMPGGPGHSDPGPDPDMPPIDEPFGGFFMDDDFVRMFVPSRFGGGEVVVVVTDPQSGKSIEARAAIAVDPPPELDLLKLSHDLIDVAAGSEVELFAVAVSTDGEVIHDATITWKVSGSLGELVRYDGPHDPEFDPDIFDGTHPNEPGTSGGAGTSIDGDDPNMPDPDPWSDGDRGFSSRLFVAGSVPGEGSIIVEAVSPAGRTVTGEIPVILR